MGVFRVTIRDRGELIQNYAQRLQGLDQKVWSTSIKFFNNLAKGVVRLRLRIAARFQYAMFRFRLARTGNLEGLQKLRLTVEKRLPDLPQIRQLPDFLRDLEEIEASQDLIKQSQFIEKTETAVATIFGKEAKQIDESGISAKSAARAKAIGDRITLVVGTERQAIRKTGLEVLEQIGKGDFTAARETVVQIKRSRFEISEILPDLPEGSNDYRQMLNGWIDDIDKTLGNVSNVLNRFIEDKKQQNIELKEKADDARKRIAARKGVEAEIAATKEGQADRLKKKASVARDGLAPLNEELSSHLGFLSGYGALRSLAAALRNNRPLPKEKFRKALEELKDMRKYRDPQLTQGINSVEAAIEKLIGVQERWNLLRNAVRSEKRSDIDDQIAIDNEKGIETNEARIRTAQRVLNAI